MLNLDAFWMCELLWSTQARCFVLIYMEVHGVESIIGKICSSEVVCWFASGSGDVVLRRTYNRNMRTEMFQPMYQL